MRFRNDDGAPRLRRFAIVVRGVRLGGVVGDVISPVAGAHVGGVAHRDVVEAAGGELHD